MKFYCKTYGSNFVLTGLPVDDIRHRFESDSKFLEHDLLVAGEGILRIHFIYNLNASDVRRFGLKL